MTAKRIRRSELELNKMEKAAKDETDPSVLETIAHIYEKKGITGLYAGLAMSLALVSNPAVHYGVYEKLLPLRPKSDSWVFLAGAMSKFCATIATYPVQVCKTHSQKKQNTLAFHQVPRAVTRNWTNMRALYGGMGAKLWQTILTMALMMVLYERVLTRVLVLARTIKRALQGGRGALDKLS